MAIEVTPDTRKPEPKRYPDNPGGDSWEKMEHADGPFFLCHTNISEFKPSDVVSAKELGPHAQIERLIRLGAMSEASAEHADAYLDHLGTLPPKAATRTAAPVADPVKAPEKK